MSNDEDARFMALALTLGRRGAGRTSPNPAVGAVIVKDGVIVGRGWTQDGGRPHAEPQALARAGAAARGATMYVTLEPCSHHGKTPPCADAIVAAGIARVVAAIEDPNPAVAGRGHDRLRAHGVKVDVGVGAQEALRAHAGHIRAMRDKRPHVTLKLAISADGKAGLAGRKPVALTGEVTRGRVHLLRAMNDAILVGIGTALADDPALTCRLPGLQKHSPVRVVLDRNLKLPTTAQLVRGAREVPLWMVAGGKAPRAKEEELRAEGADVIRVAETSGFLSLPETLRELCARGITRLLVEGGPTVAASFVKADLVDEAWLLRAPLTIGADGIDALEGLPLNALTDGLTPRLTEMVGPDTIEIFERD